MSKIFVSVIVVAAFGVTGCAVGTADHEDTKQDAEHTAATSEALMSNTCYVWCYNGTGTIWNGTGDDSQMVGGHTTVDCSGSGWSGQITCGTY